MLDFHWMFSDTHLKINLNKLPSSGFRKAKVEPTVQCRQRSGK